MRVSDPTPFLEREIERASGSGIVLVIDHALGGGANRYREELVRERLEEGDPVGVVSFNLPTLQYTLELHARGASRVRFALASLEPLRDWAAGSLVKEIFFNDAVSFPNPAQIPRLLADLKEAYGVRLAIATHDYFVLCPSPYLLDHEGGYCDLPSPEVCRRCLPRNRWVLFGHGTGTGIEEWRAGWGRALASADRILCYSDSSRQLLLRVFPWLQGARIETRPHLLEDMPVAKPSIDLSAPLILGVVGTITYHKGSGILRVLGDRIRARSLDVRIVVLGTLDEPVDPDVVTVTGSYRRNHLPRLIEKSGANLMLLPSVVPETFSYVAAELMQMEVPLVCFDIGAPAERIARYPLGQVIPLDEPDAILDRLIGFHEELREGAREPQPV